MKYLRLFVVILLLPLFSGVLHAQKGSHHVVFAMTSPNPADWELTLGNIGNLRKALAPETVEVEVVAYGPGIVMLKAQSSVAAGVTELEELGVRFVACENSMRRMKLTKDDLTSGVDTVPSGVAEVIRKQEAGWAYIKAGQ